MSIKIHSMQMYLNSKQILGEATPEEISMGNKFNSFLNKIETIKNNLDRVKSTIETIKDFDLESFYSIRSMLKKLGRFEDLRPEENELNNYIAEQVKIIGSEEACLKIANETFSRYMNKKL